VFTRLSAVVLSLLLPGAALADPGGDSSPSAVQDRRPQLLVLLVVDQMRGDYIARFEHQWTGGLRRLLDQGARFPQAAYPYFNTVTCAGHATIATGAGPAGHGLVLNAWWDRGARQMTGCTDDPSALPVLYGAARSTAGHSAHRLRLPTLADELRAQLATPTRVVSLSLKARSAIALAGQRADAVVWFDDAGVFATSSAFAERPVPFVAEFVARHPVEEDFGRSWQRILPETAYVFSPEPGGRTTPAGWSGGLPHALDGGGRGVPDALFYEQWQRSPFSDEYLGRLAFAAVEALDLGRTPGTDVLAVAFSALDKLGHDLGPDSHEVQDLLVRLDRTIGTLLDELDRTVGRGRYTVALSADHGVAPVPEQMQRQGFDAGRIDLQSVVKEVERGIGEVLGAGRHVDRLVYTDLYLTPAAAAHLRSDEPAREAVLAAARRTAGVWRTFWSEDLLAGRFASDDAPARAASRSQYRGRSGDIILLPRPYWLASSAATTHGTGHGYDTRVPLILFGRGIAAGEYLEPVTPADIAPTLAFLTGVTLAQTDGRVLSEALAAGAPLQPATLSGIERPPAPLREPSACRPAPGTPRDPC
jgi:predicted AlkP superfamily pyrophosphatase or phosphodiesterase